MDIYHYHSLTGEYLGKGVADPNPLEEGNWLMPANSTVMEPLPPEDGKAIIWSDQQWSYLADHRGETWWNERGQPVVIQDLGNPADSGLSSEEPEPEPELPPLRSSLYKTEIYERMTDAELDVFDNAIERADRRTRLMWRDCLEVQADSPLFPALRAQMTAAFGEERANTILSLDP